MPDTAFSSSPIGEVEPADHIHLPQLHRPGPFPPPIIRPPPLPLARHHQPVPHQRPIDTGPARHRTNPVPGQLVADPVRTPPRMRPPDLHNPGLGRRAHLMRTTMRPRRTITQPLIGGIPPQPGRARSAATRRTGVPPQLTEAPSNTSHTARNRCSPTRNSTNITGSFRSR